MTVEFTLDGRRVTAPEGELLVHAAARRQVPDAPAPWPADGTLARRQRPGAERFGEARQIIERRARHGFTPGLTRGHTVPPSIGNTHSTSGSRGCSTTGKPMSRAAATASSSLAAAANGVTGNAACFRKAIESAGVSDAG